MFFHQLPYSKYQIHSFSLELVPGFTLYLLGQLHQSFFSHHHLRYPSHITDLCHPRASALFLKLEAPLGGKVDFLHLVMENLYIVKDGRHSQCTQRSQRSQRGIRSAFRLSGFLSIKSIGHFVRSCTSFE